MTYPSVLHPEPLALQQTTADLYLHRRRSVLSLWGPWVLVLTSLFEPSEHIWWEWGLILNMNSSLLPSCWGFSFALGHGVSPHSGSSIYCLTGVSLTLDVGYLLSATPALCSQCSLLSFSSSGPSDSPPPPAPCLINTCSTLKTLKVSPQPLSSA